ncbi:MAG: transglutaminase-like cysteine peptidase [Rhodospirillales bacterium]|nr:transglutaminase-like cysteine peptidase [Rhodospirillales bacterium]
MRVHRFLLLAASLLVAGLAPVHAQIQRVTNGQDYAQRTMRVYGPTDPPYAFWRLCDESPAECQRARTIDSRFEATVERMAELDRINRLVNAAIEPVTDGDLYGVSDYWTLPRRRKGDCEDYALLKRKLLVAAGWPASALLITVVRDERMEGHAVLTARTQQGDFILDNKTDDLRLWSRTPYRYVMRQSFIDPKSWVALDPAQSGPLPTVAGMQDRD